ncbi:related to DUF1338 domain protein [Pseudozyma flocculosa]|nr:related to DUF1338 domain protein [Pseudozyma flocculosa]
MVAKGLHSHHPDAIAARSGAAGRVAAESPAEATTSKPLEGAASRAALADPQVSFLHTQSQLPEISSDETASVASSDGGSQHGIDSDSLRALFASSMSQLYKSEVPLYGDLLDIVADVNGDMMIQHPSLVSDDEISRLNVERHGAVRVGTPAELAFLSRIFRVLGMRSVGYYDLWADAGLPIHSTAFRPIGSTELMKNPFRIFCSLLRIELIGDLETRQLAERLLASRRIASPRCVELLEKLEASIKPGEADNGDDILRVPHFLAVPREDALEFIEECLQIFKWHSHTNVSKADYELLKTAHPLVADIVSFRGPHINHLTPRTLDIDEVQREMGRRGIDAKEIVEGPPPRINPIYLRQTSFHALSEQVSFSNPFDSSARVSGHHTARFGEIEQRGQALTGKGADLYDEVMRAVHRSKFDLERDQARKASSEEYMAILRREFDNRFTDDADEIRRQGLGFFRYRIVGDARTMSPRVSSGLDEEGNNVLESLIRSGNVVAEPIVFEDFLPASAAGIFQSNLKGPSSPASSTASSDARKAATKSESEEAKKRLEAAVGTPLLDPFELYSKQEVGSLEAVAKAAGLGAIVDLF